MTRRKCCMVADERRSGRLYEATCPSQHDAAGSTTLPSLYQNSLRASFIVSASPLVIWLNSLSFVVLVHETIQPCVPGRCNCSETEVG